MLSSITPLGERARHHRWAVTAGIYVVAAAAGGLLIGMLAAWAGSIILASAGAGLKVSLVAAVLALGLVCELTRGSVPGPRRQVDERWLVRYRRWVYAGGYGVQLGPGVTTIVVSSAVYVTWVTSFASASPATGAVIGAAAGAMRGAGLLVAARVRTPESLLDLHQRMSRLAPTTRRGALLAQLGLTVAASLAVVAS